MVHLKFKIYRFWGGIHAKKKFKFDLIINTPLESKGYKEKKTLRVHSWEAFTKIALFSAANNSIDKNKRE